MMYAQDYDEVLPCDYYACNSSTTHARLLRQLQPYTKNTQILYCPSAGKMIATDIHPTDANLAAGNISYYYFSYDQIPGTVQPPTGEATFVSASFLKTTAGLTPANAPRIMTLSFEGNYSPSELWLWSDPFYGNANPIKIHSSFNASINVGYLDGHVKFAARQSKSHFR
jgi:prepilin-type processing-associated H-X9-DG protein